MGYDVVVALVIGVLTLILVISILRKISIKGDVEDDFEEIKSTTHLKKEKQIIKKSQFINKDKKKTDTKFIFDHEILIGVLKGHSSNISGFDISSNGRQIISIGNDRSLFLWKFKEIFIKNRRVIRSSVALDHGTAIKFSPDDRAVVLALGNSNTVRVIKVKKETNTINLQDYFDFKEMKTRELAEVIDFGIASNGFYLMTCHNLPSACMMIWSLKDKFYHQIDTGNMVNYGADVSPCGRYVASCGFSSDVRVWHVEFDIKSGDYKQVTKAFCLGGHKSSVMALSFSADSSKIATISIDGKWHLWNIPINYKSEEPRSLKSNTSSITMTEKGAKLVHIALSHNGDCLVVGYKTTIEFIDTDLESIVYKIDRCHSDPITCLCYEPKEMIFLSSGGKHINVWDNQVSKMVENRRLLEKLRVATDKSEVKRLNQLIENHKQTMVIRKAA